MRILEETMVHFFCQAEEGIRHFHVTGVQTCALPILGCPQGQHNPQELRKWFQKFAYPICLLSSLHKIQEYLFLQQRPTYHEVLPASQSVPLLPLFAQIYHG